MEDQTLLASTPIEKHAPESLAVDTVKPLLNVVMVHPPDCPSELPDESRKKLQKLTIADLISELMALAPPIAYGATAPPNTNLPDLNLPTRVTTAPVSHGATISLES